MVLSACSGNSYSGVIKKMKTYSGETVMANNYMSGYYTEEGFMLYQGEIVLYNEGSSSESTGYVFITLPNSTQAPNSYYCLYSWHHLSTSYDESASFFINNSYTSSTSITFSRYTGDSSMRQYSQRLAESCVDLLLTTFDIWLQKEHNTSLKRIGMFPDY